MGCTFRFSLPLPLMQLKGRGGDKPQVCPHRRYFRVTLKMVPDGPDNSANFWQKTTLTTGVFWAAFFLFQNQFISSGGGWGDYNATKQNVTTLTRAPHLDMNLVSGGAGAGPLFTGSASAPSFRGGQERKRPLAGLRHTDCLDVWCPGSRCMD